MVCKAQNEFSQIILRQPVYQFAILPEKECMAIKK